MPTTNRQTKRKKGGPMKSRPPTWTGAQASPTLSPSASNRPQPPAPQANGARPDHPHDRVLQSLAGLTRATVTLTTKTAISYEGVIASTTARGSTTGVTLRDVKDLTTPGVPLKDLIFIASTNIEAYTSGPADSKPVNAFRTDTEVSQKKPNNTCRERTLQAWRPNEDALHVAGDNDDTFGDADNASWDQFAVNAKLFDATGGFNKDDYTTNTDRKAADLKERELKAERIAAEILETAPYNPHIKEEHGIDDSGADEKDKYGVVVRGHNAYIPPIAHRGAGGPLPPSSPIATISTTAAPTSTSNEVPKISVNEPDGATVSQSQSPSEESPSPVPGAANDFSLDFVTRENERLSRMRLARIQSTMDKRKADFVKLSQKFKLNQPIPKDIVPSNATSIPTIDDFPLPWSIQSRCRFLVLQILKDHGQQARMYNLSEGDAQTIVDYLDIVSHEVLDVDERRRMLSLLCRLAKSTRLFPRCYMLTGIEHTQETVAGGSFTDIWRGKHGEKHLCLKVIRVYRKQESDNILRTHVQELALWAHLSHANILPFYGVYLLGTPTPRICLISPWMERGNLRDYLDEFRQKPRLPFISDIVNGLAYLHGLPIVHNDIKAQNVLVSEDERALITDFGLSSVVSTTTLMPTGGTMRFMPPELVTGDGKVTKSCDIWSFACLCYEILTNELPFYQYKDTQIVMAMLRKEIPRRPEQVDDGESSRELDEKVWNLLVRCWDYEPRDRPDCEAIQETLKDTGFQDNRPEAITKIETGFTFWQAMKEQSGSQVDYGRVADILLPICSKQALGQDLE